MGSDHYRNDAPSLLLGRYQVQGVQSEDDLRATLAAFDPQAGMPVSIETLRLALLSDPAARGALDGQLNRQYEAGMRVGNHPHLVAILDLVHDAAGIPFLIREFLPGGTLAERMAYGPLPLADALHIIADCARGLQAAHNVGLVHRHMNPAQISFAADGRAKVGGFGSAQIDDLANETQTVSGIPAVSRYLGPEQINTTGYVSPASDQYGLGVILYEMLTGAPHDRQNRDDLRARMAALPPPVAGLIDRLTAAQPEQRYPAMRDVIAAIDAIERAALPAPAAPAEGAPYWPPQPAYPAAPDAPHYAAPPGVIPQRRRTGRRAVLAGLGGLALAGAAGGAFLLVRDRGESADAATPAAAPPTVAPTIAAIPTIAATPTRPATVAPPTATPPPTLAAALLPTFSSKAIAADMADPNQWNVIVVEQSARTLDNGVYTVRVSKKPDGKGLLSWGDWVPKNVALAPQFMAEVEMRLTGDPKGSCGGMLLLFNYVSANDQQQFLTFLLRGDGNYRIAQQRPGGEGDVARVDWTPSQAIKTAPDAVNVPRVSVRAGKLNCAVNGQQVAQIPVPAELAGFSAFALAARVLTESGQRDASAIFRNLRYEPFTG